MALGQREEAAVLDEALVDAHLVAVPGLGTLTARGLAGGDLEGLGGQADGTLVAEVLGLSTLDDLSADLLEGLDLAGGQGDTDLVALLSLLLVFLKCCLSIELVTVATYGSLAVVLLGLLVGRHFGDWYLYPSGRWNLDRMLFTTRTCTLRQSDEGWLMKGRGNLKPPCASRTFWWGFGPQNRKNRIVCICAPSR